MPKNSIPPGDYKIDMDGHVLEGEHKGKRIGGVPIRWKEFQNGLTADCGTHRWYILPAAQPGYWRLERVHDTPRFTYRQVWRSPFATINEAKAECS